jgi:hypothetical protein
LDCGRPGLPGRRTDAGTYADSGSDACSHADPDADGQSGTVIDVDRFTDADAGRLRHADSNSDCEFYAVAYRYHNDDTRSDGEWGGAYDYADACGYDTEPDGDSTDGPCSWRC